MGRGEAGRGPRELQFPALLRCLAQHIDLIADTRQKAKVNYPLRDCYLSGFAMFYLQDPSLLEFQRHFQHTIQTNNLKTVFVALPHVHGHGLLAQHVLARAGCGDHDLSPLPAMRIVKRSESTSALWIRAS
jgi:hypothetical protein